MITIGSQVIGGDSGGAGGGSSGPAIGSGTYAARPASPSLGDAYLVTSGQRMGSYYQCRSAGVWTFVDVQTGLTGGPPSVHLDAECLPAVQSKRCRAWKALRGVDAVIASGIAVPWVVASSLGGMPALGFGATVTGAASALYVDEIGTGLGEDKSVFAVISATGTVANRGLLALGPSSSTTASVGLFTDFSPNFSVEYDGAVTYNTGNTIHTTAGLRTVAWTWDKVSATSRAYVGGAPTATPTHVPGTTRGVLDAASRLVIGYGRSNSGSAGDFTMHALLVFPRRLSDAEVSALHTLYAARFS